MISPDLIGLMAHFLGVFDVCLPRHRQFFRSRIDHMIDLRHPLAVLTSRMP
ncbi:MAG: hypothetical protein RJB34_1247 [Pseudomonadota bacterium]